MTLPPPTLNESAYAHFQENFVSRNELGASFAAWHDTTLTLDLAGGFQDREKTIPWTSETPVLVWSATKAVSATCLLLALHLNNVSLDKPVAYLWPEFAQAGKDDTTIRMVLHHQAGLSALDQPPDVYDRQAVVIALEKQTPAWTPGSAQGYHPRTFGFLIDELNQRLTGESIGSTWRTLFGDPLNLDFWIGLPEELHPRVAPVFAPKATLSKEDPFMVAYMTPGSLTSRSFASPRGLHSAGGMNEVAARTACFPGWGGIGTAVALAKFYAMLASDGCHGGTRFLPSELVHAIFHSRTQAQDLVLHIETAFSLGFMSDPLTSLGEKSRTVFGPSPIAAGHPGAGGSVAFAIPNTGIGCAYVMNQMETGVLPNLKCSGFWNALFSAA